MIMWSGERSVERERGKNAEWVLRTANQAWDRNIVQTYDCKKNMKAIVWGCFWDLDRTNLYIMDSNFESKEHGYLAKSYLEFLEAKLKDAFKRAGKGYQFMQDNAPIHTAKKVTEWFARHKVEIMKNWHAFSPDLNPTEHVWRTLKKRVFEIFPEIAADISMSEDSRKRLKLALKAAWDTLDKESFDKLY